MLWIHVYILKGWLILDNDSQFEENVSLMTYVGIQNQPEGDQPQVSVQFPVSLRVFCIAFALSKLECKNDEN